MKHKIISTNAANGTIVVEYLTDDDQSLNKQSIEVPIVQGSYLTGPQLEHHIAMLAPFDLEKRALLVSKVENAGDIQSLIQA